MENVMSKPVELNLNSKNIQVTLAAVGAIIIWIVLIVIGMIFKEGDAQRYIVALGGSWTGIIQTICYGLFIYAIMEINKQKQIMAYQFKAFDTRPLQFNSEHTILTPEQVAEKKREIVKAEDTEEKPRYWLIALIIKVCNQYRNNNSVSETYNMLTAQVKTSKEKVESDMEPIRYIIQAISMLGFLGTVIGLTDAIAHADGMLQIDPAAKELALKQIINNFAMAFGTTLVALALGLILTQRYHSYLRKMDFFFARMESYIIDNLIIRIYNPKP